jgi:hypothetical protein
MNIRTTPSTPSSRLDARLAERGTDLAAILFGLPRSATPRRATLIAPRIDYRGIGYAALFMATFIALAFVADAFGGVN